MDADATRLEIGFQLVKSVGMSLNGYDTSIINHDIILYFSLQRVYMQVVNQMIVIVTIMTFPVSTSSK